MQAHEDALSEFWAGFDQGAAIPSVDAAAIRQMSEAANRMFSEEGLKPNMAAGLGAFAAYGFDASLLSPQQFMAVFLRQNLLNALVQRGVLKEYMQDEKSREKVYLAAATIPCDKDDVAEAFVQLQLSHASPETAEQAKQEMKRIAQSLCEEYDPDQPRVDRKFVAWMRDNC